MVRGWGGGGEGVVRGWRRGRRRGEGEKGRGGGNRKMSNKRRQRMGWREGTKEEMVQEMHTPFTLWSEF